MLKGESAIPSPIPTCFHALAAASVLLRYAAPALVRGGREHRWACNRARLVATARGVHGRNRLEEGMRREGTVAVFFPESTQIGNLPVDAAPMLFSLSESAG